MTQYVAIPDVLNAIEKNVKAFLEIAGEKPGFIRAQIDCFTGTASIVHTKNVYNGKTDCTINFPAARAQTRLTSQEVDRWIGFFLHELCHALYTDESAWKDAVAERLGALVNAMEDVRIERKFNRSGVAANSRDILNSLLAWAVSEVPANYDPNDMKGFPWLLAMAGRVMVCGYDLPEAKQHLSRLSPAMKSLVADIMADIEKANDTGDILAIARKLKASLSKPKGDKPEGETGTAKGDKPEGKGKAGEDSEPDDCTSDDWNEESDGKAGEKASQSDSEDAGEDEPGEGETRSNPSLKAGEGKAGEGSGSGGESDEINADFDSMNPVDLQPLSERQKAEAKELTSRGLGADAINESNIIEAIRGAQKNAGAALGKVPALSRDVTFQCERLNADAAKCASLRQQIARVIKAEESESWQRGTSSGRVDRFAYGRIVSGITENVFAKRTISEGYETEIAVIVDASGSMAREPIWAATVLAYVIAQAAQQVGVKCEVIRFHSYAFNCAKGVNETPSNRETQKAFARMGLEVGGSTPLAQSIIKASARLAMRAPQKRKMVFAVSDGMDDGGPKAVKAACAYAEGLGVETVALCIGVPVHEGFRHGVTCDVANIAQAGLGKLVQVLERSAAWA